MRTFEENWAQEIADVSGSPEYQTAKIEIRDPSLVTTVRDIITGQVTQAGDPVVWDGIARVTPIRATGESTGNPSQNPTGIKGIRVQINYASYVDRIRRGWQVCVTDGGRNHKLEDMLFVVDGEVNSSNVASITFECTVDVETFPNWAA